MRDVPNADFLWKFRAVNWASVPPRFPHLIHPSWRFAMEGRDEVAEHSSSPFAGFLSLVHPAEEKLSSSPICPSQRSAIHYVQLTRNSPRKSIHCLLVCLYALTFSTARPPRKKLGARQKKRRRRAPQLRRRGGQRRRRKESRRAMVLTRKEHDEKKTRSSVTGAAQQGRLQAVSWEKSSVPPSLSFTS